MRRSQLRKRQRSQVRHDVAPRFFLICLERGRRPIVRPAVFNEARHELTDSKRFRCYIYSVLARFERLAFGAFSVLARCKRTDSATRPLAVIPALDVDENRPTARLTPVNAQLRSLLYLEKNGTAGPLFDGVTKELSQRRLRDQQPLPDPDAFYGPRP
jgi:hypothetical protein